jgi:DNA-directed RNA polymerase subunit RPC12/RpoP
LITKERPLEGSTVKIDKTEALVECPHCSYRGRPKYWDDILAGAPVVIFQCPACGKTVEEMQGKNAKSNRSGSVQTDQSSQMSAREVNLP